MVENIRLKWVWIGFLLALTASMINAFSYVEQSTQFAVIAFVGRAVFTASVAVFFSIAFCVVAWLFRRKITLRLAATIFAISWMLFSIALIIPGVTRSSPSNMVYLFAY